MWGLVQGDNWDREFLRALWWALWWAQDQLIDSFGRPNKVADMMGRKSRILLYRLFYLPISEPHQIHVISFSAGPADRHVWRP